MSGTLVTKYCDEEKDNDTTINSNSTIDYHENNVLFDHCKWRAFHGDFWDKKLMMLTRCRNQETDLVAKPLGYILCRSLTKLCLCGFGLQYLFFCFNTIDILLVGPFPLSQTNKIKIYGLTQLGPHTFNLNVSSLVIRTECQDTNLMDRSSNLSLGAPVQITGFAIDINTPRACVTDKTFFTLEGSVDNGEFYSVIGSSQVRWTSAGMRFLNPGIDGCVSSFSYDYNPPWPWYFGNESAMFLFFTGSMLFGSGALACFHRHHAAKRVLFGLLALSAALSFVASAGFASLGMLSEAFHPLTILVGSWTLALALATPACESIVPECLAASGLYFLAARILTDCAVFHDCVYLAQRPPVASSALAGLGLYFLWRRRRVVAATADGVLPVWADFDSAWRGLLDTLDSCRDLARIQAAVERLTAAADPSPMQRNRVRAGLWGHRTSTGAAAVAFEVPATLPGTAGDPVTSICQLYSQAMFAAPLLLAACTDLAAACGGRIDLAEARGATDELPASLRRLVLAGTVKDPERAVAKAATCYGGEAARLLDVCRCRIVVDSALAASLCLEAVAAAEAEVMRVVRVRNWLLPGYDARATAGFRAVVLNVTLGGEQARRLGVENHVCEVQVVHEAFAAVLRAAPDHTRRYAAFRDMRGAGACAPSTPADAKNGLSAGDLEAPASCNATAADSAAREGDADSFVSALPSPSWLPADAAAEKRLHGGWMMEAVTARARSRGGWDSDDNTISSDPVLLEELAVAARAAYMRAAIGEWGALDRHALDLEEALAKSSSSSVFFSSKPHVAYATKTSGKVHDED